MTSLSSTNVVLDGLKYPLPSSGAPASVRRKLQVSVEGTPVGTIFETGGVWGFEYDPSWMEDPAKFSLAPSIPFHTGPLVDAASERPIQRFFDNLLPEEQQRALMSRDAKVDPNDSFALLEFYGRETAGALTLAPLGAERAPAGKVPLPDEELQARLDSLPAVSLANAGRKKMSLAGAQHKMAIIMAPDGSFMEPVGSEASTHILKPDHQDRSSYAHSVINEWFCMNLAKVAGLKTPAVHRRYVPSPVYVIERFDREVVNGGVVRRFALDGCQLLDVSAHAKYKLSAGMFKQAANICAVPAVAKLEIARWMIFNCLIANGDCHLKNISFMPAGRGAYMVAPFYDLLSTGAWDMGAAPNNRWPNQSDLAFAIGQACRFGDLSKAELMAFLGEVGLSPTLAGREIDKMATTVAAAAHQLCERLAIENQALIDRGVDSAAFEGEARLVRQIVAVIGEMSRKLGR